MKPLKAKIYLLTDSDGKLIDDIDTDQIFHNQYLSITDIDLMGQYALDNLKGYEDFASKVEKGMIVVAGENFGSGSSRQQAVDCFISLGLSAVAAFSFGAIYKRNTINAGFPLIEIISLDLSGISTGSELLFNPETGDIANLQGKSIGQCKPFSPVQSVIIEKEGLLNCL